MSEITGDVYASQLILHGWFVKWYYENLVYYLVLHRNIKIE